MKTRRFWPTIWIAICTLCEFADRLRTRGPGGSRYPRRRTTDERKKRSSGPV
jgi:hypothetical protein